MGFITVVKKKKGRKNRKNRPNDPKEERIQLEFSNSVVYVYMDLYVSHVMIFGRNLLQCQRFGKMM